jgi:hypothetical protein
MRRAEQRAAGLALVAAGCAVALLGSAPGWTQWLAAGGFVAIAWGSWRAGWLGVRHRIFTVCWHADGRWLLADRCGSTFPGQLSAQTRVLPGGVWLRWRTGPRQRRSMLLTAGDLPAGQLRALAVRLRIEALERALPESAAR